MSYTDDCPMLASVLSEDDFSAVVAEKVPSTPVVIQPVNIDPAPPPALDATAVGVLLDYFMHLGDNPCAPHYCGVNVDIAADRAGIDRATAALLYAEYQVVLADVSADAAVAIQPDPPVIKPGGGGKVVV